MLSARGTFPVWTHPDARHSDRSCQGKGGEAGKAGQAGTPSTPPQTRPGDKLLDRTTHSLTPRTFKLTPPR